MDSAPPTSSSKSHMMRSMMLDVHPHLDWGLRVGRIKNPDLKDLGFIFGIFKLQ